MIKYDIHIDRDYRRCQSGLNRIATVSGWTPTQLRWHARCLPQHFYQLQKLRALVESGRGPQARRLEDQILNSFSGALCATVETIVPRWVKKGAKPISVEDLEKMVRAVRPTRRIFGFAKVKLEPKSDGTLRITLSPDWKVRAAQQLSARVLDCWNVGNPFDYNSKGRGPAAAVSEIVRLIEQEGIRSFVIFDLANFFSSVKPSHLKGKLPIPHRVMKHTLFYNSTVHMFHPPMGVAKVKAARQCLPAGARLSGIVAVMLLGRILRKLSGARGIVTFVDDGVIGGCDPAGAKCLVETLKDRFNKLPGGPLDFKFLKVVTAEEGFSFLGYWIRLTRIDGEERVRIKPSHEAKMKLRQRLFEKLSKLGPSLSYDAALDRACSYFEHWRKSFPLWHPNSYDDEEFEGRILEAVTDFFKGTTSKSKVLMPGAIIGSNG